MRSELIEKRNKLYSGSPLIYWVMSVFCILVIIGCMALDLLIPASSFILIALLFFPILFACFATLYSIKFGGTVSLGSTLKIGLSYYSSPNYGCFRLLRNFFKALLVFIIGILVFEFVLQPVFASVYGQPFIDEMNEFYNIAASGDTEALTAFYLEDNLVNSYLNMVSAISASCAIFAFIFGVVYSSISLYFRINIRGANSVVAGGITNQFFKMFNKEYRKDFWYLNWPLFLLLLVGIVFGFALVILLDLNFAYLSIIPNVCGFVFILFFLPFAFANMETLFDKYSNNFKESGDRLTKDALNKLRQRADLTEEDKAKIDELLQENNKKDSIDNEES